MSKLGYFSRYMLIINKVKAKPYCTILDLEIHLRKKMDQWFEMDSQKNAGLSKRTLQRDFQEIRRLFGIDIEYSKKEKGYFISNADYGDSNLDKLVNSFNVYNALQLAGNIKQFVFADEERSGNTDLLYGLIHAIKSKQIIHFDYQKFWEKTPTKRTVEPFLLREFRHRWYVFARVRDEDKLKTFALDRLTNLEISSTKFTGTHATFIFQSYKHCFGIIGPNASSPTTVVLSFPPYQGKFIKSLPLHTSQTIIADNEEELLVRLHVFITHDFKMELLSFGANVKVIRPASLARQIMSEHQNAFKQYQSA